MRVLYAKAVYGAEEMLAVQQALLDGWLGEGKKVKEFEDYFKKLTSKPYAAAVNSGSSANYLALKSLNLPVDSCVITPVLTFNTVLSPILMNGLRPVFFDVESGMYVASVKAIEKAHADSVNVSAVMIPHLIGNCAEIAEIRSFCDAHGLKLIEDCCDTIGSTYAGKAVGSYGHAATFSFYASHHITAAGGGGMVLFEDGDALTTAMSVRDWGRGDVYAPGTDQAVIEDIDRRFTAEIDGIRYDQKFFYRHPGVNMKMIEVEAAFGIEQMKKLESFNEQRKRNFDYLMKELSPMERFFVLPKSYPEANPSWLAFPLMLHDGDKRNDLVRHLEKRGVQTRMIFSGNITRHYPYRHYLRDFPGADMAMRKGFLVGAHHGMGKNECDHIVESICEFLL